MRELERIGAPLILLERNRIHMSGKRKVEIVTTFAGDDIHFLDFYLALFFIMYFQMVHVLFDRETERIEVIADKVGNFPR